MSRIQSLREKRGKLIDDMDGILAKAANENRELNADEIKEHDSLKAQFANVDATLLREVDAERLKAELANPVDGGAPKQPVKMERPRYGKLKAFHGEGADERAYRSGQWLMATIFGKAKAAEWCRENGIAIVKAQSEGVNSAGGFLVPDEFSNAIIDLRETFGVARREARVMPMARDTLIVPRRTSGVTAYFTGEGVAITASQMAWDNVQLVSKKLAAYVLFSSELADDAVINLADTLAGEIAYAFAEKEDDCLFNGTGAGGATYAGIRGIRTQIIDGTHTAGAIDAASGNDTFAEYTAADLTKVMSALPEYAYGLGASWYTSIAGWNGTFQRLMAATGGTSMDIIAGKAIRSYLGYPVVISQKMPTAITDLSDTAVILFGNMAAAVMIGDRRSVEIATSEHIKFAEDQIAIRGTERIDINVHSLGDTTTAGPLVALIAE